MNECLWIYIHTKGIFVNSFLTQHCRSTTTVEETYLFVFINIFSFQLVNLFCIHFTCIKTHSLQSLPKCHIDMNFFFSLCICLLACFLSLLFFIFFSFCAIMETQNKFVANFYCSRFHNASHGVMSIGIFTLYSIPLIIV